MKVILKKGLFYAFFMALGLGIATVCLPSENRYPIYFPVIKKSQYTVCYDGRAKIPLWVHEKLTKRTLEGSADRSQIAFYQEDRVYQFHRGALSDYRKSGFDRGHMAPAADHMKNIVTLEETFSLANICPQNPQLNRGYWRKLEQHIRSLVADPKNDYIDVITGPLFLVNEEDETGRYIRLRVIGKNDIHVPTHFFKRIQITSVSESCYVYTYIIPNEYIDPDTPLSKFHVKDSYLEKVSGLAFH